MQSINQKLSAFILTVLLMFGQTAALLHQLEHDEHVSQSHCSVCLAQSLFDDNALVLQAGFEDHGKAFFLGSVIAYITPLFAVYPYLARSPPIS